MYNIFSFYSDHVFFKSCPDSQNGYNCDTKEVLGSPVQRNITFDTRLRYRNGGPCGINQDVLDLRLLKLGGTNNVVYNCTSSANISYCLNDSRFKISYQGRDKYDFQIILSNLTYSDTGLYKLEIAISRYRSHEGWELRPTVINQMFDLTITSGTFYLATLFLYCFF